MALRRRAAGPLGERRRLARNRGAIPFDIDRFAVIEAAYTTM
jgi:hypothetical protein